MRGIQYIHVLMSLLKYVVFIDYIVFVRIWTTLRRKE